MPSNLVARLSCLNKLWQISSVPATGVAALSSAAECPLDSSGSGGMGCRVEILAIKPNGLINNGGGSTDDWKRRSLKVMGE